MHSRPARSGLSASVQRVSACCARQSHPWRSARMQRDMRVATRCGLARVLTGGGVVMTGKWHEGFALRPHGSLYSSIGV